MTHDKTIYTQFQPDIKKTAAPTHTLGDTMRDADPLRHAQHIQLFTQKNMLEQLKIQTYKHKHICNIHVHE